MNDSSIPSPQIRLFILDDHALFREGLLRLLESDPRFHIAGHTGDPASALSQIEQTAPDVLILDYDLGSETALQFMASFKQANLQSRVLLVTAGLPDDDALALIRLGISGIFQKQDSPEALQHAIFEVSQGRVLIDQQYLQSIISAALPQDTPIFTERERTTLRFLLQGLTNKEIASRLGITESAIKATLQQLFTKTNVRTRSQLVLLTIERYRDQL